jgi:hypothetical protein
MTSRRAVIAGLLVLAAAGAAVFFAVRDTEAEDESLWRALRARATVSDRLVAFGDTIRADVEVFLDRRRVEPGAVRVRADFGTWRAVAPAQVDRMQSGNSVQLRVRYVLRCAKQACVPERDVLGFQWEPARVEFVERGAGGGRKVVRAPWPALRLHTRVIATDLATTAPWRLDATSVPEPSWRAEPTLLAVVLGAGALFFLATGGVLAFVGWPRRRVEPEPEPEPEPELRLTPLEQALELLEDAARANGAGAERRSLELVAEVLAERGESDELARRARTLAWSPTTPRPEDTKALAASVRATLEEELRQLEEERLREEEERRRRLEEAHAEPE